MTEPSVAKQLKKKMRKLICYLTCKDYIKSNSKPDPFDRPDMIKENDCMQDNLNSFLTSSLNVELVYTILRAISNFVIL